MRKISPEFIIKLLPGLAAGASLAACAYVMLSRITCPFELEWMEGGSLVYETTKRKNWKLSEMDTDHVAAWSKDGATDINNCQLLCKTHNRAKGNR